MSLKHGTVVAYLDEADYAKLMTICLMAGKAPGTYLREKFSRRIAAAWKTMIGQQRRGLRGRRQEQGFGLDLE